MEIPSFRPQPDSPLGCASTRPASTKTTCLPSPVASQTRMTSSHLLRGCGGAVAGGAPAHRCCHRGSRLAGPPALGPTTTAAQEGPSAAVKTPADPLTEACLSPPSFSQNAATKTQEPAALGLPVCPMCLCICPDLPQNCSKEVPALQNLLLGTPSLPTFPSSAVG